MRLSVVIPTWCEREHVIGVVRCARRIGDEVVVVDASSPDGTAEAARRAGARTVRCERGRGPQLARGAAETSGDVLLFLHADARLPPEARGAIARALADERVCAGSFRLTFTPPGRWARFFSWGYDVQRRWARIIYGDSGLFVRRAAYEAAGGFAPLPLMEDLDLVRRLRRRGRVAYVRDVVVRVSDRRFVGAPVRTMLGWVSIQTPYGAKTRSGMRPAFRRS